MDSPSPSYSVSNETRASSLGSRVLVAGTSRERRAGLLRQASLPPGAGLWIAPCEAVHTFRMKFAIDVLFLDRKRSVLKLYREVAPNRICWCVRAHSVLELPAGTIDGSETQTGDRIELRAASAGV